MRKALSLVLAGAMAFSLVGCSSSDDQKTTQKAAETTTTAAANDATEASSEAQETEAQNTELSYKFEKAENPVTIKVVSTYAGEDAGAAIFQKRVKEWEDLTGNTVDDQSATASEEFKQRVSADFQTGAEPDVLFYFNGTDSDDFVSAGKVVSVDTIRETYPEYAYNMNDDLLGASPVDGVNYSIPVNGYWEGMFANKKVLEAAGVDLPTADTTWDEFLEMCGKIKEAGYTPIAVSLNEEPHYWFEYAIYNHRSVATHNALPTEMGDEQSEAWVAGLNDITTLYKDGYLPENALTIGAAEASQLFFDGKAAFQIDGNWKIGGIKENVENIDDYTVTYVPGMGDRKSTDIISGISSGYFVTQKAWEDAEKQAAVVNFIEYMTQDEVVSEFAAVSATALKNGPVLDESTLTSLEKDAIAFTSGMTGYTGAVQDNLANEERAPIFTEMSKIVSEEKTAEEAVEEVLDLVADR